MLTLLLTSFASAQEYMVTDLGTLGGEESVAYSINDLGQVVGQTQNAQGELRPFLWNNVTGMIPLSGLPDDDSKAVAINSVGDILVTVNDYNGLYDFTYVWRDGGVAHQLPGGNICGHDINDQGTVVGASDFQAFLWDEDSGLTMLGTLEDEGSVARAINELGQIVGEIEAPFGTIGFQGFIWQDGEYTALLPSIDELPPGVHFSSAYGINDNGQVVGFSYADTPSVAEMYATMWDGCILRNLGTLGYAGSRALSNNNANQVVGWSEISSTVGLRAFIWDGSQMMNLNDLIPEDSGWILEEAKDINERGQIVGYGLNPEGIQRAFLLTPVIQVPQDYDTIQEAIEAAEEGNVIIVSPGTYYENINFLGKAITVKSAEGPEVTVIDGNQQGSVVAFLDGEGADSILEGFTVTNGNGTYLNPPGSFGGYLGGGIYCNEASPTLINNIIDGNAAGLGAGVGGYKSSPQIIGNVISNNSADSDAGGGIYLYQGNWPDELLIIDNVIRSNTSLDGGGMMLYAVRGDIVISHNLISRNTATYGGGGISAMASWGLHLTNNVIQGNSAQSGGGIEFTSCSNSHPSYMANNTIVDNMASWEGGGLRAGLAIVEISNEIIWGNEAEISPQVVLSSSATVDISYSDIQGGQDEIEIGPYSVLNWDISNIDAYPRFKADGYHLRLRSPCRNAGDPDYVAEGETDIDGDPRVLMGRIDMGADEFRRCHSTSPKECITPIEMSKEQKVSTKSLSVCK